MEWEWENENVNIKMVDGKIADEQCGKIPVQMSFMRESNHTKSTRNSKNVENIYTDTYKSWDINCFIWCAFNVCNLTGKKWRLQKKKKRIETALLVFISGEWEKKTHAENRYRITLKYVRLSIVSFLLLFSISIYHCIVYICVIKCSYNASRATKGKKMSRLRYQTTKRHWRCVLHAVMIIMCWRWQVHWKKETWRGNFNEWQRIKNGSRCRQKSHTECTIYKHRLQL